jgi:hypothetical protein
MSEIIAEDFTKDNLSNILKCLIRYKTLTIKYE